MNSCSAILQTNAHKIIGVIQELKKGQLSSSIFQQNIFIIIWDLKNKTTSIKCSFTIFMDFTILS